MLQAKDFVSFCLGAILTLFGLLPLLRMIKIGPSWFALQFLPVDIFAFILAIAGAYLLFNSIIEVTNSNPIGKVSIIVACVVFILGFFQVLNRIHVGPAWFALAFINPLYHVLFIIEGVFLMIAMFAMEL
jgi:hypothetical protein